MNKTTRQFLGAIAGALLITAAIAAQEPQQTQQKPPIPDVTVTGCLTQGSSATVFVLGNAKMKPEDKTEIARTFVVVPGTEDLNLKDHLSHEVSVTGLAENKVAVVPPAGQKISENDLPKFTVKSLVMVADRCTSASR